MLVYHISLVNLSEVTPCSGPAEVRTQAGWRQSLIAVKCMERVWRGLMTSALAIKEGQLSLVKIFIRRISFAILNQHHWVAFLQLSAILALNSKHTMTARFIMSADLREKMTLVTYSLFRSEEHTSELQSRPHISYAVFCLKKKKKKMLHV